MLPIAQRSKSIGEENHQRVRDFFTQHLCATNVECARTLGMNVNSVGRHVRAIRAEWLTKPAAKKPAAKKPAKKKAARK